MASIRKNVTVSEEVEKRANELKRARAIDEWSDLIATLIREDYERRGLHMPPGPDRRKPKLDS